MISAPGPSAERRVPDGSVELIAFPTAARGIAELGGRPTGQVGGWMDGGWVGGGFWMVGQMGGAARVKLFDLGSSFPDLDPALQNKHSIFAST